MAQQSTLDHAAHLSGDRVRALLAERLRRAGLRREDCGRAVAVAIARDYLDTFDRVGTRQG